MSEWQTVLKEYIWTPERRGQGTEENPWRMCPQLWTKDGRLVAEYDPATKRSFFAPSEGDPPEMGMGVPS